MAFSLLSVIINTLQFMQLIIQVKLDPKVLYQMSAHKSFWRVLTEFGGTRSLPLYPNTLSSTAGEVDTPKWRISDEMRILVTGKVVHVYVTISVECMQRAVHVLCDAVFHPDVT